jgi:hypothetical protein
MMKKLLAAALVGSLLLLATSCGTTRRFATDVFITVGSPLIIPYGGMTDGYLDAKNMQTGLEASDGLQVFFIPFTFTFRVVDHTVCCTLHALDIALTPFYAIAEIGGHPDTKIEPMQIYRGTWFDPAEEKAEVSPDAATGEGQ